VDPRVVTETWRHERLRRFNKLMTHCKKGNFIVLDIDETMIVHGLYPCMLLTPQGVRAFSDVMRKNKGRGDLKNLCAIRKVFQDALMKRGLIEKGTAEVVHRLQEAGCRVFGLTSRYSQTAVATRDELLKLGIDLSIASPFPNTHLLNDPITKAACQDGIIFSNGQAKGPVLNRFLEGFVFHSLYKEALANGGRIANLPSRVPEQLVFVDDREQNCLSVQHSLRSAVTFGIQLITYHYTRASYSEGRSNGVDAPSRGREVDSEDGEEPAFDVNLMNKQLHHLFNHRVVIGDSEAHALIDV